ncbi:MAG TPA: TldD/PmbA family protein [Candidatus Baltobacteraceae bacterium]
MDKAAREALGARILERSNADHTEALVHSAQNELTRFTHNAIHQNVASNDVAVSIRAIVGLRTGVARTNVVNDDSLQACVERAIALARLAPEDPGLADLPNGGAVQTPPGAFAPKTADATPAIRTRMCEAIFEVAERDGLWAAGYASTNATGITILNTRGATASFDGTAAGVNVKMNADDSTGFGEAYANDVSAIGARTIAETAAQKALASAKPRAVDPGEWTVILEPAAFGELFSYIGDHFSAQSFDEGSSFLSDGLDKPYLGENVTIRDDYAHPLAPGMPIDFEGQPTQRLALVEDGVGRAIVTDSYWAKRLNRTNTGHALPAPNAYGPQASHLVVDPGSASIAQLIAGTKRGLLISRFWYIRTVDQRRAIVTGMTRDGTFLIEDGSIVCGVRNMRFNHSVIEALRHCEFSSDVRRTGSFDYSMVVPSAKIEGFTFTSGTDF